MLWDLAYAVGTGKAWSTPPYKIEKNIDLTYFGSLLNVSAGHAVISQAVLSTKVCGVGMQ